MARKTTTVISGNFSIMAQSPESTSLTNVFCKVKKSTSKLTEKRTNIIISIQKIPTVVKLFKVYLKLGDY